MRYLPLQAHTHKLLSVMINTSGRTSPGTVLHGMIAPYQWSFVSKLLAKLSVFETDSGRAMPCSTRLFPTSSSHVVWLLTLETTVCEGQVARGERWS